MPGKRTKNEDLLGFDYLDRESDGRYSIRHPVTRRRASLKTRDLAKAKARYNAIMHRWQTEHGDPVAEALAERMGHIATAPPSGKGTPTVAEYAATWRERWLRVDVTETARGKHGKSKYEQRPCKVVSEHTKKNLSDRTALDYAKYCDRFFETNSIFKSLRLNAMNAAQMARQALAKFSDKPTSYNHHLACLVTMLQQARRDGLIHANWGREIDQLIKPAKTAEERALYHIPDHDYDKVRSHLVADFEYYGKDRDGEWLGRACDLLLCMSSRPADALSLRDDAFDADGLLKYRTNKNGTNIEIEDESGTLAKTVLWFRAWKRKNRQVSPHLITFPSYFHPPLAGNPVSVRYLSRKFADAVVAAGYPKGRWELRHLRHTGISEEIKNQGEEANKGGHRSRAGQAPYRTAEPVTRVKNTIRLRHLEDDSS